MDISFYVLLTLACLVLLLAMWACASSNTLKWGPDLTLELPPHLLQQALFRTSTTKHTKCMPFNEEAVPSAPSELPCDPLLSNEQPMGMSNPTPRHYHPVLMNNAAVRVLPAHYVPQQKVKPVFCTFQIEKPA